MCVVIVLGGIGLMIRAQKKAQEYEEAFKKGMAAWDQKEGVKAVAEFRKAAKVDDRDPELWVMIGRSELISRNAEGAQKAWEEALKRDPAYKPALFERGKEAFGRHLIQRVPPPVDGSSGWLPLRLETTSRDEAQRLLADLREASGSGPGYTKFAAGAIYLLDGRYRDACPGLQEYSDQTPWDATAIGILGVAAQYAVLPDRAERILTEALTRRPGENAWLKVRADARYLQGKYEEAKTDYKDAGLEKEAEPLFARRIPAQGMILWLKADAGVDVTGASVTKWQDQSKAKNDAAPKEPEGGPKVTASAVRGRPAILFAGGEDELRLPDGFEDFSSGLSMFVVGEPNTEKSEGWAFLFLATAARGAGRIEALIGGRRESDQVVYAAEDLQSQVKPFVAGVPPAKAFESYSAIHEPSGAARLFKRGSPAGNGTLILPRKTLRTRNRVGTGLKGHLAEVVLYNRSLSEMERVGVDAYLNERYFPVPPAPEKR